MSVLDERILVRDFLEESIADILTQYGRIEQFNKDKVEEINAIHNKIIHIFDELEKIKMHGSDADSIFDQEFNISFFSVELPMFVILDFLSCFCYDRNLIMQEDERKRIEDFIQYTRNLPYSCNIDKDWHVSSKFTNWVYSAEIDCLIRPYSNEVTYKKKDRFGNIVNNRYNSTIELYQTLYPSSSNNDDRIYDYQLNYDYEKYPELLSPEIWLVSIQNRRYEWGTWRCREANHRVVLFKEQEESLKDNYNKIKEYIRLKELDDTRQNVLNYVIPYLEDSNFIDFSLVTYPYHDSKEYERVQKILENIYMILEDYRKSTPNLTLKEALENEEFLKDIRFYAYDLLSRDLEYKSLIASQLVEYILNNNLKTDKNSYQLKSILEKCSVEKLDAMCKKTQSKLFGKSYMKKVLNNII